MKSDPDPLAAAVQHYQVGRFDEAASICRQIVELDANNSTAWHLLGVLALQSANRDAAVDYLQRAIELNPSDYEAASNLGTAFAQLGDSEQAIHWFRRAVTINPHFLEAWCNLGLASKDLGALDEALACCQAAMTLKPDFAQAHHDAGIILKDKGRVVEAIDCFRRVLDLQPSDDRAHSNLAYSLMFAPGYDAAAIYEEHRRWNDQHAAPLARHIQPHSNDRSPNRRLKIGYVSPNFRHHVQALFLTPLFSAHDHTAFEIHCYSSTSSPDNITESFRRFADVWHDISGLGDERSADLIRTDRIDILVDLTMHMTQSHLLLFARKPAPIQVCWLAYPGTTGLTAIDYRLTDPYLDPPGLDDKCYSEQSIRLPDTFWCYDPLTTNSSINELPALTNGYVTFGSLNNFCKVNERVLQLWARVVRAVEGSRLMILAPEGSHRQQTLEYLKTQNVSLNRVAFLAPRLRPEYLQLYHQIDIGLDTFPYNGHTTSLDSVWMGVPVVTLKGHTVVGRAGASQLSNLGLQRLIANNDDEFVQTASDLAGDLASLRQLRASLRGRMQNSPLMDAARFARGMEAAYRTMWRSYCGEGEAPPSS